MINNSIYFNIFIIFIGLIISSFIFDFLYRTLYYKNHLTDCSKNDSFCGIQIINVSLPDNFVKQLNEVSINKGKRIEIPKKHQKNISSSILINEIPDLENFYKDCASIVSNYIGEEVIPVSPEVQTRMCLVVYEKEGDYIDWHFDTNHYNGRFFTLLVPVTLEPTCGNYQYKNNNGEDKDVEISKGQAILFEGDKVFHRGKELCKDQRRVIMSLTYVTNNTMNLWNYSMYKIKEFGVFGK